MALAPVVLAAGVVAANNTQQNETAPIFQGGEILTCPDGMQVQSRFTSDGDAWEVTGTLLSGLEGMITVAGPTGEVSATPAVNLVVTGEPVQGEVVTLTGTVVAVTGDMVATAIEDKCPAPVGEVPPPEAAPDEFADEDDDGGEGDEGDDDDSEGDGGGDEESGDDDESEEGGGDDDGDEGDDD